MYTDAQNAIRNTLWNFMGSIMDACAYDNKNKKEAVTALMSEEMCKFCKVDDKTIDIYTAKPILKAAKWVLEAQKIELESKKTGSVEDVNSIIELNRIITHLDNYINKL